MKPDFATRLCQEVLGEPLVEEPYKQGIVSIPILYEELTPEALELANESTTFLSPQHYRMLLPLVLHAITNGRDDLENTGYFTKFFQSICSDFTLDPAQIPIPTTNRPWPMRYSTKYKEGWVVRPLTALNKHELQWSFEWVNSLLDNPDHQLSEVILQDLSALGRVLAMALDLPETDAPELPGAATG